MFGISHSARTLLGRELRHELLQDKSEIDRGYLVFASAVLDHPRIHQHVAERVGRASTSISPRR
jgi:hypothetical protein